MGLRSRQIPSADSASIRCEFHILAIRLIDLDQMIRSIFGKRDFSSGLFRITWVKMCLASLSSLNSMILSESSQEWMLLKKSA